MRSLRLAFALICVSLVGCGGEKAEPVTPEASGHRITMRVIMAPDEDNQLPVLTPAASIRTFAEGFLVGKPWVGTVYETGADIGVDRPIHTAWGTIPESLEFEYTPDRLFESGPYDVIVVIFAETLTAEEMQVTDISEMEPSRFRDAFSSFTADLSGIIDGHPEPIPGAIRYNVEDEDLTVVIENRVDLADAAEAFNDTLILIP